MILFCFFQTQVYQERDCFCFYFPKTFKKILDNDNLFYSHLNHWLTTFLSWDEISKLWYMSITHKFSLKINIRNTIFKKHKVLLQILQFSFLDNWKNLYFSLNIYGVQSDHITRYYRLNRTLNIQTNNFRWY